MNNLAEIAVSSISEEFRKYTSLLPQFKEFASNSENMFSERDLFTEKTLDFACGASAMVLLSETSGNGRVISIDRCHNRFCPLCSYIEMKKDSRRVKYIFEQVSHMKGYFLLGFTFAFPNCEGSALKSEIKHLNKTFKNFTRRMQHSGLYEGSFRKLELTYNADSNTYHPHLHVLYLVKKSNYFYTDNFKTSPEWTDMFKEVSGRYDVINFEVMSYDPERETLSSSFVNEFSHYAVKPNEILHSQEVFNYMVSALKGTQAYTLGGILADFVRDFDEGLAKKALTECSEIIIYSHIAVVNFDFDYDDYFVYELEKLPVLLPLDDRMLGRLFNCSHLLSYSYFLDKNFLSNFLNDIPINECIYSVGSSYYTKKQNAS